MVIALRKVPEEVEKEILACMLENMHDLGKSIGSRASRV